MTLHYYSCCVIAAAAIFGASSTLTVVNAEIAAPFGAFPPELEADASNAETVWASIVEAVFPTWCIDEDENRLDTTPGQLCEDGTTNGRWDPLYLTKWRSGENPALGGYPTDIDTRYPFYYGSGFFGQACAGGNSHCSFDFDGGNYNCAKCGKIKTDNDDGPNGPGHVPPHIGLAALTRAYYSGTCGDVQDWFDYEQNGCRVLPNVLLPMIRKWFPREDDGSVGYPPPFTTDGGPGGPDDTTYPYPLEYVNLVGDSCTNEQGKFLSAVCYENHSDGDISDYPDYLEKGHGSPHYCTVGGINADVNKDWCPYIFFGPKRGKYRHPHVAFSVMETWLANQVMQDKCFPTWDENDGKDYPYTPNDNSVAFPMMSNVEEYPDDPKQPTLTDAGKFIWPGAEGTKAKHVPGEFVIEKYLTPTTIGVPLKIAVAVDDPDFEYKYKGQTKGNCDFVANKKKKRCGKVTKNGTKVKQSCPVTCCGLEDANSRTIWNPIFGLM